MISNKNITPQIVKEIIEKVKRKLLKVLQVKQVRNLMQN